MTVQFNHTVIAYSDPADMARFYRDLLEADEVPAWGPFINVQIGNAVLLQFATPPIDFPPEHYAHPLDDDYFDRAYAQITASGLEHSATH